MKTLLLKEARLLLPFWLAALLMSLVPMSLVGPATFTFSLSQVFLAGGMVLMSVAPFGMEFSHGTFLQLLAQPVPRHRIWLVKVGVLSVALVSTFALYCLVLYWRTSDTIFRKDIPALISVGSMTVMVVMAGGLCTTLLLRQIAAAIWFTPLVPGVLLLIVGTLTDGFSKEGSLVPGVVALTAYAVLSLLWAAWLFRNAQDTQWTGGAISFPLPRRWSARAQTGAPTRPRRRWLALVLKELHLQQAGLMIAGVAALSHVVLILARKFAGYPLNTRFAPTLDLAGLLVWFLWLCVPVIIGAVSVAEERKLGTAEGCLCLPVNRRTQFLLKFVVVLVLGELLGALLPCLLDSYGVALGLNRRSVSDNIFERFQLDFQAVACGVLAVISFYASALARNTLQALGIAAVLALPSMFWVFPDLFSFGSSNWAWWKLGTYVSGPAMLILLVWLAYLNCRRLHEGRQTWRRSILALIAAASAVVIFTAFTFNRTWELVMPLEPRHGPATIHGSGRTKICYTFPNKVLALLPDGRLWASEDFLTGEWTNYRHWEGEQRLHIPPSAHGFLPGSNWVDIAATWREVASIRNDGSLWSVFKCRRVGKDRLIPVLKLSRIGSGTNWTSVAAGGSHFLAVKQDGTLWGWGDNDHGQLAVNLPKTKRELVQISADSDWVACFAGGAHSVGVKRDGSAWEWGSLKFQTNGLWVSMTATSPRRRDLPGRGLKELTGLGWYELAVYDDGSLWSTRFPQDYASSVAVPPPSPARVGVANDWLDVSWGNWAFLVGLKRDGTLWKMPEKWDGGVSQWNLEPDRQFKASRRSDWIAASAHWDFLVALGADGTLCAWWTRGGQSYLAPSEWLRPTRRILGSVNILESGTLKEMP